MLGIARIAGITAAKRTHEPIPLCHPLALSKVTLDIAPAKKLPGCVVRPIVKVTGRSPVTSTLPSWSEESKLAFDLREAVLD
ncbi:Molybdenum cofactor biosynthesis protein C (fragment) [Bradyrhizobium sp. STM 3843]